MATAQPTPSINEQLWCHTLLPTDLYNNKYVCRDQLYGDYILKDADQINKDRGEDEHMCFWCKASFKMSANSLLYRENMFQNHTGGPQLNPQTDVVYSCCHKKFPSPYCHIHVHDDNITTGTLYEYSQDQGVYAVGFATARLFQPKQDLLNVVALDCEMMFTRGGLEAAKVTLVGSNMAILVDKYIQPKNEILDYNSRYSGITKDNFPRNQVVSLSEVHKYLMHHIHTRTIIIGHSLQCDLKALWIIHPFVIDTAVLSYRQYGRTKSLKDLYYHLFSEHIQSGTGGHDSREDVCAAMRIALRMGNIS